MSDTNNIIQFPPSRIVRDINPKPLTEEQVSDTIDLIKYNHVEEAINVLMPLLFSNIELAGFSLTDWDEDEDGDDVAIYEEKYFKDSTVVVESIRSLLYKYHGLYHPLQIVAENILQSNEQGEWNIVDHLNVNMKPPEDDDE